MNNIKNSADEIIIKELIYVQKRGKKLWKKQDYLI